ncbi:MAG: type II toxin-antitoxin system VapC family toxin [Kiritimatiellae bacterium]|nr:type II toxin-antitoxin system VapC family toxin [Kiritimatiellia bacterium]
MKYLLDTCALIDIVFTPERLSAAARDAVRKENELAVSIASFWEIMIKQQIGKLGIKSTSAQELADICKELGIQILQTTIPQVDLVRTLPRYDDHGDPFDRLIICQAIYENMPVVTSDSKFSRYNIHVVW